MGAQSRNAFTLVEVLIVVVIMAVLAATIIPQFTDSTRDAKVNTATFNLQALRSQIEMFKAQHDSARPKALSDLTVKTDKSGAITTSGEYGPYISEVPAETITNSTAVAIVTNNGPIAIGAGVTTGGWIYNSTTGEVRVNHGDHASL
ncbi:MAG: prepilin-type N-terminal cleavage/methylation domain-containing protein [Pirellulaceae bacterium]|jgi:prepilin-type N-terminal cleavage/methylation domain-containing protein|nr:prepilin-type N-terminal cleavage/methylation domain-containing protein [Pirellulaceae bacterium]MDP6722902.1 prepilin-type N-terminal cleavage/methylation domain-containing protein [Pirellulaceae bacterium]MDP7015711.1 prepilin-type N-terminal cleavage/methylation domain-containing protein [Pirellulaceae bacterium]